MTGKRRAESRKGWKAAVWGLTMAVSLLFAGCGSGENQAETGQYGSETEKFNLEDRYEDSQTGCALLSEKQIHVEGDGITAQNGAITISRSGTYRLSGTLSEGQIIVDLADSGDGEAVHIILDGVDVVCASGPALYVREAGEVFLTLAEGSENRLADTERPKDEEDSAKAAVWSVCDLTVNGSGSLTVEGRCRNGISTKDNLVIDGGSLTVTAVNNGLRGKDSVTIRAGEIAVTADGDAVQSDQTHKSGKGRIAVEGGSLQLAAGEKGFSAESDIRIAGGTIMVVSADDCVHANGGAKLSGGSLVLESEAKGIHADGSLTVSGGQIYVEKCLEGLEAKWIQIDGGEIEIAASDDGINASDGSGRDNPAADSGIGIEITGGVLRIEAAGDGIDSNGSLTVTGGEIYVDGPVDGANGALDYAGSAVIRGGIVVAAGSADMACNFTEAVNQCAWMVNLQSVQKGGSEVTVADGAGEVLLRYRPSKEYQSVVVSCADLTPGGTYTLSVDGTEMERAVLADLITGSAAPVLFMKPCFAQKIKQTAKGENAP